MITEIKKQIAKIAPGQLNDYSYAYDFVVLSHGDNYTKGKFFSAELFLGYESTKLQLGACRLGINYSYPMHGDIAQRMLDNFDLYLLERFNIELIPDMLITAKNVNLPNNWEEIDKHEKTMLELGLWQIANY